MTLDTVPAPVYPPGPLTGHLQTLDNLLVSMQHAAMFAARVPLNSPDGPTGHAAADLTHHVTLARRSLHDIGTWQASTHTPPAIATAEADVARIIADHRRLQNTRSCAGCSWTPQTKGYASDPDVTRARHAEFNAHLAALIVEALL